MTDDLVKLARELAKLYQETFIGDAGRFRVCELLAALADRVEELEREPFRVCCCNACGATLLAEDSCPCCAAIKRAEAAERLAVELWDAWDEHGGEDGMRPGDLINWDNQDRESTIATYRERMKGAGRDS